MPEMYQCHVHYEFQLDKSLGETAQVEQEQYLNKASALLTAVLSQFIQKYMSDVEMNIVVEVRKVKLDSDVEQLSPMIVGNDSPLLSNN